MKMCLTSLLKTEGHPEDEVKKNFPFLIFRHDNYIQIAHSIARRRDFKAHININIFGKCLRKKYYFPDTD